MKIKNNLAMKKLQFIIWLVTLALNALSIRPIEGQYIQDIETGSSQTFTDRKIFGNGYNKTPMHKAIFTQRGYIQFLRWELPVPDIEEFTFCLWIKSDNLTYSHSIFSYSMNENKRLVRSWISPFGRSVNLEIGGVETMAHPTRLEENRWYHICQSWENRIGHYALWINGRKEYEGYSTRLIGHVIPRGGDIVVGQEYTDFDKGLEEGIEGAVTGFNLLLVSAFDRAKYQPDIIADNINNFPSVTSWNEEIPFDLKSVRIPSSQFDLNSFKIRDENRVRIGGIGSIKNYRNNLRFEYPRNIQINQRKEGTFESTLKEYFGGDKLFARNFHRRNNDGGERRLVSLKINQKNKRDLSSITGVDQDQIIFLRNRRTTKSVDRLRRRVVGNAPLGLQLIHSTYSHCEIGRGSPYIGGSKMLISWTRTPVKIFGGAILKNVNSICGHFLTI